MSFVLILYYTLAAASAAVPTSLRRMWFSVPLSTLRMQHVLIPI